MTKFNCSLIFFHCNLYPFVTFSSSSQELNVSLEYINLEEKFGLEEEKKIEEQLKCVWNLREISSTKKQFRKMSFRTLSGKSLKSKFEFYNLNEIQVLITFVSFSMLFVNLLKTNKKKVTSFVPTFTF